MDDLDDCWLVVVESEIDPHFERDFNTWYESEHIPALLKCPGYRQAARYRSSSLKPSGRGQMIPAEGPRRYFASYWIDGPDALVTPEHDAAVAGGWGPFEGHVTFTTALFEPLGKFTP